MAGIKALVPALFLCACATSGSTRYLLITDTYHEPIIWSKFKSLEDCNAALRESDPTMVLRCVTRDQLRS